MDGPTLIESIEWTDVSIRFHKRKPVVFYELALHSISLRYNHVGVPCTISHLFSCFVLFLTEIQDLHLWEDVGLHEQQEEHGTVEEQPWGHNTRAHHWLRPAHGVHQHRVHQPAELQPHAGRRPHWLQGLWRGHPNRWVSEWQLSYCVVCGGGVGEVSGDAQKCSCCSLHVCVVGQGWQGILSLFKWRLECLSNYCPSKNKKAH